MRLIDADRVLEEVRKAFAIKSLDAKYLLQSERKIIEKILYAPTIEMPTWIPCSERLPDEYDEYLCQCGDGDMIVGWLENSKWCKQHVAKETIVAWMPLPEPYREGGEEK